MSNVFLLLTEEDVADGVFGHFPSLLKVETLYTNQGCNIGEYMVTLSRREEADKFVADFDGGFMGMGEEALQVTLEGEVLLHPDTDASLYTPESLQLLVSKYQQSNTSDPASSQDPAIASTLTTSPARGTRPRPL